MTGARPAFIAHRPMRPQRLPFRCVSPDPQAIAQRPNEARRSLGTRRFDDAPRAPTGDDRGPAEPGVRSDARSPGRIRAGRRTMASAELRIRFALFRCR